MKDLVGRFKFKRFSRPTIKQAFDFRHRPWVGCSEVRAFWNEVPDEIIRALIHSGFLGMIGRGKEDLGLQRWAVFRCPANFLPLS